jgi:hypothetical protein
MLKKFTEGIEHEEFPKIYRISRPCIITEKIDGTNSQIIITDTGFIYAGSKKRLLTGSDDNFGFYRWVMENKEELMKLGVGRHYGEWWGQGIQRGYGLKEKRFSLFNTKRWNDAYQAMLKGYDNGFPKCCHVVPVLYEGMFSTPMIDYMLGRLRFGGSRAVPGFMSPEGIVIYHIQGNFCLKKTLDGDGHKGVRDGDKG